VKEPYERALLQQKNVKLFDDVHAFQRVENVNVRCI